MSTYRTDMIGACGTLPMQGCQGCPSIWLALLTAGLTFRLVGDVGEDIPDPNRVVAAGGGDGFAVRGKMGEQGSGVASQKD